MEGGGRGREVYGEERGIGRKRWRRKCGKRWRRERRRRWRRKRKGKDEEDEKEKVSK